MNCNICDSSSEDNMTPIPDEAWKFMDKLPGFRYWKEPVWDIAGLYQKYLMGTDDGAICLVMNENKLYRFSAIQRIWIPLSGGTGSGNGGDNNGGGDNTGGGNGGGSGGGEGPGGGGTNSPSISMSSSSLVFNGNTQFEEQVFTIDAAALTEPITLSWVDNANNPITQSIFAFEAPALGTAGGEVKVKMIDVSTTAISMRLKITSSGVNKYINISQAAIPVAQLVQASSGNGYNSLLEIASINNNIISVPDTENGSIRQYPDSSMFGAPGQPGMKSMGFYFNVNSVWVNNTEVRIILKNDPSSEAALPVNSTGIIWGSNASEWIQSIGSNTKTYTRTGGSAPGNSSSYNWFGLSFSPTEEKDYAVEMNIELWGSTNIAGTVKKLASQTFIVQGSGIAAPSVPASITVSPRADNTYNNGSRTLNVNVTAAGLTEDMTITKMGFIPGSGIDHTSNFAENYNIIMLDQGWNPRSGGIMKMSYPQMSSLDEYPSMPLVFCFVAEIQSSGKRVFAVFANFNGLNESNPGLQPLWDMET
jgi:hypothetical protein